MSFFTPFQAKLEDKRLVAGNCQLQAVRYQPSAKQRKKKPCRKSRQGLM
jgi:hypothetical protein